jgi:hypothetical protein
MRGFLLRRELAGHPPRVRRPARTVGLGRVFAPLLVRRLFSHDCFKLQDATGKNKGKAFWDSRLGTVDVSDCVIGCVLCAVHD